MRKYFIVLLASFATLAHAWNWKQIDKPETYCSGAFVSESGQTWVLGSNEIYLKSNEQWQLVYEFNLPSSIISRLHSVISVKHNHLALSVNYDDDFFGERNNVLIIVTENGGQSWSSCSFQEIDRQTNFIKDSSDNLYICYNNQLYKSINLGLDWTMIESNLNMNRGAGLGILHDSWFVLSDTSKNLFISTDSGFTWTKKSINSGVSSINGLIVDQNDICLAVYVSSESKYKIVHSTDDGDTWQTSFESADQLYLTGKSNSGHLFSAIIPSTTPDETFIYESKNRGVSWEYQNTIPWAYGCSSFSEFPDGSMLMSANSFLYQSTDEDEGFTEVMFDNSVFLTETDDFYRPAEPFKLNCLLFNKLNNNITDAVLYVILEIEGSFFFAPSFSQNINGYNWTFPPKETTISILQEFPWPGGIGEGEAIFYAGLVSDNLMSNIAKWDFSWGF